MEQMGKERETMMRGCERRIYHVRSADSPCFEEAYLILRRGRAGGVVPARMSSRTMAEEAERIIRESAGRYLREKKRAPIHRLTPPAAFALGAGTSSVLIGAAVLLVGLF